MVVVVVVIVMQVPVRAVALHTSIVYKLSLTIYRTVLLLILSTVHIITL